MNDNNSDLLQRQQPKHGPERRKFACAGCELSFTPSHFKQVISIKSKLLLNSEHIPGYIRSTFFAVPPYRPRDGSKNIPHTNTTVDYF